MVQRNRISREALQKAFDGLPAPARITAATESFAVASAVLRGFLGAKWFDKHVTSGFLTIDESTPKRREETLFRVIDLSEVLYNLQNVTGFDECIERMRNRDIEGTYAELDLGRMLFLHKAPFRYVVARGIKKRDYDVEIIYPNGVVACAEAKCKIESTEFRPATVIDTLNRATGQLPDDHPSIIFVKVPPRWMEARGFAAIIADIARSFLQDVPHVVSVKYYVSPLTFADGFMKHEHAYKEISNPHTNFGDVINWDIFPKMNLPPEWNGMPPWWQRILFFS